MSKDGQIVALTILCFTSGILLVHETNTGNYWRNQYDQQHRAINEIVKYKSDPYKVRIAPVITLAKTCVDEFGNETTPDAVTKLVLDEDRKASKIELPHCPKGTIDVNVYVGRK